MSVIRSCSRHRTGKSFELPLRSTQMRLTQKEDPTGLFQRLIGVVLSSAGHGRGILYRMKNVHTVRVIVNDTRGLYMGSDFDHLTYESTLDARANYYAPPNLCT